jgi:hypothetical protein
MQMDLLLVRKSDPICWYTKLTSPRDNRSNDPRLLKVFIAFLVYVVGSNTCQSLKRGGFISAVDGLHSVLCLHALYWLNCTISAALHKFIISSGTWS